MGAQIRTLFLGDITECRGAQRLLQNHRMLCGAHHECRFAATSDEFLELLMEWDPSLVLVLQDGAAGMESVFQCRARRPAVPVFWFSNDHDFGMQAYRLNCAYFSTKPVTPEKLDFGVRRCDHMGIEYAAV